MGSVGTREGPMGYFWQRANYFWHFAKCCMTIGGFLYNDLEVLAGCQCGWQSAKFVKSPRPKHWATAQCKYIITRRSQNPIPLSIFWEVHAFVHLGT